MNSGRNSKRATPTGKPPYLSRELLLRKSISVAYSLLYLSLAFGCNSPNQPREAFVEEQTPPPKVKRIGFTPLKISEHTLLSSPISLAFNRQLQEPESDALATAWLNRRRSFRKQLSAWADQGLVIPNDSSESTMLAKLARLKDLISNKNDKLRKSTVVVMAVVDRLEGSAKIPQSATAEFHAEASRLLANRAAAFADLGAKIDSLSESSSTECTVLVRTVNPKEKDVSKRELSNYEVVCVPALWEDNASHWQSFDSLSSPTKQPLQAGYYAFWCLRRDAASGAIVQGPKKMSTVTKDKELEVVIPEPDQK